MSGILYVALQELGVSHGRAKILMQIHQMSLIGLKPVYVIALALAVVFQFATGLILTVRRLLRLGWVEGLKIDSVRSLHSTAGLLIGGVAATLMAVSGAMYRLNKTWLLQKEAANWWMKIHVGEWMISSYWPWYPLLVGLLVISLPITGLYISSIVRKAVRKLKQ